MTIHLLCHPHVVQVVLLSRTNNRMTNYGHHAGTRAWSNDTCYVATLIRETNGNPFAHEKWRNGSISRITGWMKNRPTSPPSRLKKAIEYYCKKMVSFAIKISLSFFWNVYGLVLKRYNPYNFSYNISKFSSFVSRKRANSVKGMTIAFPSFYLHFLLHTLFSTL